MTTTLHYGSAISRPTRKATELEDGKCYRRVGQQSPVYLANAAPVSLTNEMRVVAFSLCGQLLLWDNDPGEFIEVDVEIYVKD